MLPETVTVGRSFWGRTGWDHHCHNALGFVPHSDPDSSLVIGFCAWERFKPCNWAEIMIFHWGVQLCCLQEHHVLLAISMAPCMSNHAHPCGCQCKFPTDYFMPTLLLTFKLLPPGFGTLASPFVTRKPSSAAWSLSYCQWQPAEASHQWAMRDAGAPLTSAFLTSSVNRTSSEPFYGTQSASRFSDV